MADGPHLQHDIHVLRSAKTNDEVIEYAKIFRKLRLQALLESPDSFTETYEAACSKPMAYWQAFIQNHRGLIHMAFGTPDSVSAAIASADHKKRCALILQHGKPLSMAVNTGPIPAESFLSPPGSGIPVNRPHDQEQRYHAGMFYHIPEMRGPRRGLLMEHLVLDRAKWLLRDLRSCDSASMPIARLRGNVRPGRHQADLLSLYARSGWYIAGKQTWRANVMAEGGTDAVRAAEQRGENMDEVSVVIEQIFTVSHLEWQIRKNQELLTARARL